MFLDQVIHFGETLGDRVRVRSPKKQKNLIEVLYVCQVKVHIFRFNMIFSHLGSMFLDRGIHFGETLGDQAKGRSPKQLKSFIEVPNLVHVKVHVISFNMILISSQ